MREILPVLGGWYADRVPYGPAAGRGAAPRDPGSAMPVLRGAHHA